MTTTVKRGAGRPAATARTNKHAQRTMLPPGGGQADTTVASIGDQVAEVAGVSKEQAYGRMTVPELRARLDALGGKAASRLTKGQLLNHILEAERATSKVTTTNHGFDDAALPEASAPAVVAATERPADSKGAAKADKLQDALYPYGWAFQARNYDGERVEAVLVRDAEVLTVVWDNGVFNYDETGHLVGDRHTKVRNVSAAIKLGSRPADEAVRELDRVVANKRFKPSTPRGVPAQRKKVLAHLDLATADEETLASSLAGMTIEWINRVSNTTETAVLSKNPKFFRLVERADDRTIQFNSEAGFRACRLADIVRVGGSARRRSQKVAA